MQGEIRSRRTRAQQVHNRRFALAVCLLSIVVVITAAASHTSRASASLVSASTQTASDGAALAAAESDALQAVTAAAPDPVASPDYAALPDPAASLSSATYVAELRNTSAGSESPRALLRLNYDALDGTVSFSLEIDSPLANPSVAAICQGSPGQSGRTLVTVFAGPAIAGNFSGILAQGDIVASDLVGPLQGQELTDLILLVKEGDAYATVGTTSIPIDAVRGQIL